MGLADLLILMEVPYDSPEARQWGERLMAFLDREAKATSAALAKELEAAGAALEIETIEIGEKASPAGVLCHTLRYD